MHFLMSWNCVECTRYWGRVHSQCPLCQSRWSTRMALLRVIPDPMSRRSILAYLGMRPRVRPLWKGYSLCSVGTPYNCRCERCRAPIAGNQAAWNLLARLSRKHGRGRAKAARWMYLLSGLLSPTTPSSTTPHGVLEGMFMAADIARGPRARFINANLPAQFFMWAEERTLRLRRGRWRWAAAIFLQFVSERADFRGLCGSLLQLELESDLLFH